MNRNRKSGILLHVTSLPDPQGIGNFGPAAYRFVDFLVRTGQTLWQVLPIGPTGYGDSPYQCYSAFAGNPLLISLELLAGQQWLKPGDLPKVGFPDNRIDFEKVHPYHRQGLEKAFERFESQATSVQRGQLANFASAHADWLDDYALFQALKRRHGGVAWTDWDPEVRSRLPEALEQSRSQLQREMALERFIQFQFWQQWKGLKAYANQQGVSIIGDLPIFVAHDSSDVWAHQDLFSLEPDGRPTVVAGVPPDYFSETGQLWGNPLYRWEKMAQCNYAWWVERFRHSMELFDFIRLDHFRGFEAYWEIPGTAPTAAPGRWVRGPGPALFLRVKQQLGTLPIIAEDLGVITPEVEALRDQMGFPGMRVLQFAFGDDPKATDYQPHNYVPECVVYTGTHDNDTVVGWFTSQAGEGTTRTQASIDDERARVLEYINSTGQEIHWDMIRLALASVANTAMFPLQDLLGLSTEARMNMPGSSTGNWMWRFRWEDLTPSIESRLRRMTSLYGRAPEEAPEALPSAAAPLLQGQLP